MVPREQIEAYAAEVARQFQPEKIILFGSYAYGTPTEDSDVDLLVIMRHRMRAPRKATEISMKVRPPFPTDLLVRTPKRIAERLAIGDYFIEEILTKGKLLYEADNGRVGRKGRGRLRTRRACAQKQAASP